VDERFRCLGVVCALLLANFSRVSSSGVGEDGGVRLLGPSSLGFPGASLNGSGGVAEFVFRFAARELFGVDVGAGGGAAWVAGRNDDLHELALVDPDTGKDRLRFAAAYGFRNIQTIITKMRRSAEAPTGASIAADAAVAAEGVARRVVNAKAQHYDFVEIMACPSGCLNGGAQVTV
jgi:hypothetical protein